jgi:hypothetical protein
MINSEKLTGLPSQFFPLRDEATGSGEDYTTRNLMTCTHHQILFG